MASFTVTTTDTVLPSSGHRDMRSLPSNAQTIYIGPAGVTAATGYPILPGEPFNSSVLPVLYAVTASGTADLRWL